MPFSSNGAKHASDARRLSLVASDLLARGRIVLLAGDLVLEI